MPEAVNIVSELLKMMAEHEGSPNASLVFAFLMKLLPSHHRFYETQYLLNGPHYTFFQDDDKILSLDLEKLNALANLLDDLGATAVTGYYDPEEDEQTGNLDSYTGFYYLTID